MAADIYIAAGYDEVEGGKRPLLLSLESDGYYWFLYRYFESANLDHEHELIDLYGGGEIEGYQLDRLEDELRTALLDVTARPKTWKVLVGWQSEAKGRDTEDWRTVEKDKVVALIEQLLGLIRRARESRLKLVCLGD
jgi:hypothetical protein